MIGLNVLRSDVRRFSTKQFSYVPIGIVSPVCLSLVRMTFFAAFMRYPLLADRYHLGTIAQPFQWNKADFWFGKSQANNATSTAAAAKAIAI